MTYIKLRLFGFYIAIDLDTRRIAEIDRLIEKVFEQNATGILSNERFAKMLQSYEKEQKALTQEVSDSQQTLQDAKELLRNNF